MNISYVYALIAAILSSIGDILYNEKVVKNKINVSDYIIYSNIISFIGTLLYIILYNGAPNKLNNNTIFIIILLNLLSYLIISPLTYKSYKLNPNNSGAIKSILSMNIIIYILYYTEIMDSITGLSVSLIMMGFALLAYK